MLQAIGKWLIALSAFFAITQPVCAQHLTQKATFAAG